MSKDVIVLRDSTDPSKTTTLRAGDPIGGGILLSRTVTLTDAQIKALPTTGVEIIPAPGLNKGILVISGTYRVNCSAGHYTGIDNPSSHIGLGVDVPPNLVSSIIAGYGYASSLLGNDFSVGQILPAAGYDSGADNIYNNYASSGVAPVPAFPSNKPIMLFSDNNADFTGGNALNTLRVTVLYVVLDT